MNTSEAGAIKLTIPSKLGYEKVAMAAAASVAKLMGFTEDRVEDLKTAVAEACINSMEHAHKLDESLKVQIMLSIRETSLEVKVSDQGPGIHADVHTPNIDGKMEGLESPRGMGMFLIQELVDEAEWTSSEPNGGCARMVIHLSKTREE